MEIHRTKIVLRFERESGIELSRDLNVLIKVKAKFDPQYGFSVNIEDIDSSFTLGDIAKRYQQILQRLTQEGLLNNNKQLPAPFDLQNVLVIAPENAAGLGDFKKMPMPWLRRVSATSFIIQPPSRAILPQPASCRLWPVHSGSGLKITRPLPT